MNDLAKKILLHSASLYKKVFNAETPSGIDLEKVESDIKDVNEFIRTRIRSGQPFMAARFGSGELDLLITEHIIRQRNGLLNNSKAFILGRIPVFWWDEESLNKKCYNAGIFPANQEIISGFYDEIIPLLPEIDILGSWLKQEQYFANSLQKSVRISLADLEPYYHPNPWSAELKGKKVLIIHPFEKTIRAQYKKRKLLFANPDVLPDFELLTIKAVQSIACTETRFNNWFEALNDMKEKISNTDFDIAIIGCGAYGMPLAAHVKSIGKQTMHLGGATQILFGIKGKRWNHIPEISSLYNELWINPLPEETPENFMKIENGCYW